MALLPLFLFLAACTDPPTAFIEEPAEVETCEWLIPAGIELVNDYVYTLEAGPMCPVAYGIRHPGNPELWRLPRWRLRSGRLPRSGHPRAQRDYGPSAPQELTDLIL